MYLLQKGVKMRALTKDSKNLSDLKEIPDPKKFSEFANKKTHAEFFCKSHMKDRLLNYCNQDLLVDVVMTIQSLKFQEIFLSNMNCKCCNNIAEYRIDRID